MVGDTLGCGGGALSAAGLAGAHDRRAVAFAAAWAVAALLSLPAGAQDYGDTPYVQTPMNVVDEMLRIARVGPKDYLIDLGSGDGRIVITAAKRYGARGFGVDLDQRLVRLSNAKAREAGVADRAVFYPRNLYETDIRQATVLTTYLLPEVNLQVRRRLIEQLRPGTRIVTHDYDFGDWEPDISMVVAAADKPVGVDRKSKVFFWVVPERAAGDWTARVRIGGAEREYVFRLGQRFQVLSGDASIDGAPARLAYGRLLGKEVSLSLLGESGRAHLRHEFRGAVQGDRIDGTLRVTTSSESSETRFSARRTVRRDAEFPIEEPLSPPPPTKRD
jgi:hypothetical protein